MAEGLTFTLTGNGKLGGVEPGWSSQEFATPVNPNERAGGTGVVSFSAEDVSQGVLAINKSVVSSVEGLGSISGTVRSASKTGQRISVSHDNKLARYNAVRNMPPMVAASLPGCLDLAEQMLGEPGFTSPTTGDQNSGGGYWSLFGHSYGVDVSGNHLAASLEILPYQIYNNSLAEFQNFTQTIYRNNISAPSFATVGGICHATQVYGDYFVLRQGEGFFAGTQYSDTKFILMGKSIPNSTSIVFSIAGEPPGGADGDYYIPITATINPSTEEIIIEAESRVGGIRSTNSTTTSAASLDFTQEIAFRIYISATPGSASPYYPVQVKVGVCNTSDYTTVVTGALNISADLAPIWFSPWSVSGNVRALWKRDDLISVADISTWPPAEQQDWETARSYAWSGSVATGQPSVGFTGPIWEWLQEACSTYRWEIALVGDVVTARPVGNTTLSIGNNAPSPTLIPTATRTGRQVDIVWQNATVISGGEVYDARSDDNRIISVNAAQETVTKIQTNAYLTSILQPTRVTTFIPGAGTYYVIDSTGLPIVANQWEEFGGALSVEIDDAEAGTIVVTFTGPRQEIPSTTSPYSLAVSDGVNQYAALSINGSGVVADPQTLNLLTGANPDITPQQVAFSVNNPFINSLQQAYDSGIWAAVEASGPKVELNVVIPTVDLTDFGLTAGALIVYNDSTYRAVNASIGATQTTITAVRHATVGAFDTAWNGQTVANHDAAWATYLCEDQKVLTYRGA